MARVILTTTSEAQRKAEEQEQAKEDLQRQVIRLLDDVEGAARGDLTVQAEVTADVLGAVADSFNLTIQNLREIVQQVKTAARQVSKGSTENEMFARQFVIRCAATSRGTRCHSQLSPGDDRLNSTGGRKRS